MVSRPITVLLTLTVALSALGAIPGGSLGVPSEPVAFPAPADNIAATAQHVNADADLRSGESFWQGWELAVDASGVVDGTESLEVWLVTEGGELSQRVDTVTADESGTVAVTTEQLRGRYVLRYEGQPVYVQDGTAYLSSPPDGSAVTVETSSFEVVRQTLAISWSDPEVFPGQGTALTISSNRDEFVVAVSSRGLVYGNLTALFPRSSYAPDHDALAEDDRLLVEVRSGSPILLNTSVLAPGTPNLQFDVQDTTPTRGASLTVKAPASNRRFAAVEWQENVGDVLEVEVACGNCYLAIGTPERGTIDLLELQDGDGDGRVTVRINTRYAGMYTGASGYPAQVRQYTSPDDTVRRYTPGSTLEQVDEELSYTVDTIGKLRDELGLRAVGRLRPLEPGALQLTLASSDFLIARSAWGDRPPYGSSLVIRDETDARTVTLQPRSLSGVQPKAAPAEDGPVSIVEELAGSPSSGVVATGDRLVFELSVSGLFGYFEAEGLSTAAVSANEAEGIDLALYELSGGTEDRVAIDRLEVRFVPDEASETLYVVFETGGNELGVVKEGDYRFEFSLRGVSPTYAGYSIEDGYDGYPYLDPDDVETVTTTVAVEPPSAEITEPRTGSSPGLSDADRLTVSGVTNVATGSTLDIEAASTEYAWTTVASANVVASGEWVAALDFSDAPGEEVTISVIHDGDILAQGTFTVDLRAASQGTPAPEGGEGPGDDGGANGDGGSDGGAGPDGIGGGSIIPGVPNLVLFGGGIVAVLGVLAAIGRAFLL